MATKKLNIGSIQKKKDGSKTFVVSAYELKNLKQLLESPEVKELMNSSDPKAKKYFNLESKQEQLASLDNAVSNGKLSNDMADKIRENVNKIPDFVIANVSTLITVK